MEKMEKIAPSDPETRSADLTAENIAQLKALFPEAFTEGKIDFDVLKQLLGGAVDDKDEKYGLNWHGKRRARQLALTPSTGTLRPCPEDSVDWDTTQNLMIEGDNLEVLKLLQKSYSGKVKLIYIDPPYNTGKDFVYPDDYRDNIKNYLELTGQVDSEGGSGSKISSNTESSGRFHTDWLNMMQSRLILARNLLNEDGIILISIDDNEIHNLKSLLDSVFGIENSLGSFVWQGGRKNDARLISLGHDYILVYAKNNSHLREIDARWREKKNGLDEVYKKVESLRKAFGENFELIHLELLKWFRELPDEHPSKSHSHFNYVDRRGIWFPDNLRSPNPRENLVFDWKGYKPHPNGWAYGKDKMAELDADNRLFYPESKEQRIKLKSYLHEHETWPPGSVFYKDRRAATKYLDSLMGCNVFDFPKDVDVIARLIQSISVNDDLILDFFAGSGTTGHATFFQNCLDGINRKFILVQLPEPLELKNKDQQVAAEFCTDIGKPLNIAELTKERLRRAGKKVKTDNPLFSGDMGFRVFKLDSSNIRTWDPDSANLEANLLEAVEHIKEGRKEADVLYELLLKLGLELTVPIETRTLSGKTVYSVGAGTLIVCLAESIVRTDVEELAQGIVAWHTEQNPAGETTCVFRDSAFENDVAKTNLAAILEQHGLTNVRSL